ncbi:MAG: hypothetical protein VX113_08315, partial [Pseudomonadota bacterium]|nr:hypothetical protein [Pseudomonadota bacterium]
MNILLRRTLLVSKNIRNYSKSLQDSDRIFKNLYGRNNWNLDGDMGIVTANRQLGRRPCYPPKPPPP